MKASAACSICGNPTLNPGPMGRMAVTGAPPHCPRCESLERHRVIHKLMRAFPNGFLNWRWGIQFSPDASVEKKWFRSLEQSHFGGNNDIDVQNISRRDGSFDFISINHVLESVPDDKKAFAELARVLSPNGFMQVTYGTVMSRPVSEDFNRPQQEWKAMRVYGRDVDARFGTKQLGLTTLVVGEIDPSTGAEEFVHFYFKAPADAERARSWLSLWSDSASCRE